MGDLNAGLPCPSHADSEPLGHTAWIWLFLREGVVSDICVCLLFPWSNACKSLWGLPWHDETMPGGLILPYQLARSPKVGVGEGNFKRAKLGSWSI